MLRKNKQRKEPLSIVTWNIRGLTFNEEGGTPGKLQEIVKIMVEKGIDIVLLQETYVTGAPEYKTKQGKYRVMCSGLEKE